MATNGPVIDSRFPSDIFDRVAGWGHSATTNYNPSTNTNVTVQAVWNDPHTQISTGDANDLAGQNLVPIPQTGSPSDAALEFEQPLGGPAGVATARDGVVSAVTLPVTQPTASFNSVTNGVTTSQTYSTLAAQQTNTVNYGGTSVEGDTDYQQGNMATVLADRFYGFGHGSATTAGQTYGTGATIAVSAPGLSTYEQKPYDQAPNQANYEPQTPSPLLGTVTTSHKVGTPNVNVPVVSNINPSWGGINDRTSGFGHLTGGSNTVTIAGQSVVLPALHD